MKNDDEDNAPANGPVITALCLETILGIFIFPGLSISQNVFYALTIKEDHALKSQISRNLNSMNYRPVCKAIKVNECESRTLYVH